MAGVRVMIDDTDLEGGGRTIIGHPIILSDAAGQLHELLVEFLLIDDDPEDFNTLFDDTFDGLEALNPRVRYWQDSATVMPTLDWSVSDGRHTDIVASVQVLAEEKRTQRKLHCLLRVVAGKTLDVADGSAPTPNATPLPGLASKLEITQMYFDSERFTKSIAGAFKSYDNPSVEGPYNLASVSDNNGKARFTLEAPDVIVAAFDADKFPFIDVSTPSAYEGRHRITAISGGGAIVDTDTEFVAVEGDVNATLLYGEKVSAEEAFTNVRSLLMETYLGTGENGSPHVDSPHMVKLSQNLAYGSEKREMVDFVLVAGPQSIKTTVLDAAGNPVERGLSFTIQFVPPERFDTRHAPMVWGVIIEGKCAIVDNARVEDDNLSGWFNLIKAKIIREARPDIDRKIGYGNFRETLTDYTVDYTTNDITFTIIGMGGYTGTISYQRTESTDDSQPRSIWRNTDGTTPIQEPPGHTERTKVVRIEWLGEPGAEPGIPSPPAESGFEYLYSRSVVASKNNLEDSNGNLYRAVTTDHTFTRIKPVQ